MRLSAAQNDESDFRRNTDAHRRAYRAESPIDINRGQPFGSAFFVRNPRSLGISLRAARGHIERRSEERALIMPRNVIGDEPRGAEAVIENLNLDLAAVGVSGE